MLPGPGKHARLLAIAQATLLLAAGAQAAVPDTAPVVSGHAVDLQTGSVLAAGKTGPASIALGKEGTLALPAGYLFIDTDGAATLLKQADHNDGSTLLGMVLGHDLAHIGGWFVVIRHVDSGHVTEGDVDTWQAGSMLEELRAATRETNQVRRLGGAPEIEVDGWIQPPTYDKSTHRLAWSLGDHAKGTQAASGGTVNYHAYQLGRTGYFTLELVTTRDNLAKQEPFVQELLAATLFNGGSRYEDYDARTDRQAGYGVETLVTGIVTAKPGPVAAIGLMLARSWMLVVLGIVVLGAIVWKLSARRDGNKNAT